MTELVLGDTEEAAAYAERVENVLLCGCKRPENLSHTKWHWFIDLEQLIESMAAEPDLFGTVDTVTIFMHKGRSAVPHDAYQSTALDLGDALLDQLDWLRYAMKHKLMTMSEMPKIKLVNTCTPGTYMAHTLDTLAIPCATACLARHRVAVQLIQSAVFQRTKEA